MDLQAFLDAAENGDWDTVRQGLEGEPLLVTMPGANNRNTALHLAAWQGHVTIVQLLLLHGADVNALGERGKTALHYAIEHDHPDVVEVLISHGADLQLADSEGLSPMAMAARAYSAPDFPELGRAFELLTAAGAYYDLNAAGYRGDISRIRQILEADPGAAHKVSAPAYLIADIVISEWGTDDVKKQIIDLLFSHGFLPDKNDVEVALPHGERPCNGETVSDRLRSILTTYY